MRVIWKDSMVVARKPLKYRNHHVESHKGGWITDVPNDNNIYKTHYSALNAIDEALGGTGIRGKGTKKRQTYGIEIIGHKDETA